MSSLEVQAREAGPDAVLTTAAGRFIGVSFTQYQLAKFRALVRNEALESAAMKCEAMEPTSAREYMAPDGPKSYQGSTNAKDCANAIRSMKEKAP